MLLRALLAGCAFLCAIPPRVEAQSADWTGVLIVPQFPSPFISEWERNPQNLMYYLTHRGAGLGEYVLEGSIRQNGFLELAVAESPPQVAPGPGLTPFSAQDLFEWGLRPGRNVVEDIYRTDVIPDGSYQACVRVLDPATLIQLDEVCRNFEIRSPEAPEILSPRDGDRVSVFQPTFQWTPVFTPQAVGITYRLRVVEQYPQQTPVAALSANLPLFDEEVGEAPLFVYPTDALELEAGKEYAWHVEVLDGFGESFVPGGLISPPGSFLAGQQQRTSAGGGGNLGPPDSVEVVPGLAVVTDLGATDTEATLGGWIFNGEAWMEILGPYSLRGRTRIEDLELDDFAGFRTIEDGRAVTRLEPAFPLEGDLDVEMYEVTYSPFDGLLGRARAIMPDGEVVPLEGDLRVTAAGVFGTVSGEGSPDPLWVGGEAPVRMELDQIEVTYPGGASDLIGTASFFGGIAECDGLRGTVDDAGRWEIAPVCVPETAEVADASEADASSPSEGDPSRSEDVPGGLPVTTDLVFGTIVVDFQTSSMTYDLNAPSRLDLVPGSGICSVYFDLSVDSETGVAAEGARPACDPTRADQAESGLDLGLGDLEVRTVTYDPTEGFDVDASVTLAPSAPEAPDLQLPVLEDVGVDRDGLSIPEASDDTARPAGDVGGYAIDLVAVDIDSVTIPWDEWLQGGGDLSFSIRGSLDVPALGGDRPECLVDALPIPFEGRVDRSGVSLSLGDTAWATPCDVPVAPGVALRLTGMGGAVAIGLDGEASGTEGLDFTGGLVLTEAASCSDGSESVVPLDGRSRSPLQEDSRARSTSRLRSAHDGSRASR